jgi:hypothetical protein
MKLSKQDVFVESLEEGTIWAEYPDEENGVWVKKVKDMYVLSESDLQKLKEEYFGMGIKESFNSRQ